MVLFESSTPGACLQGTSPLTLRALGSVLGTLQRALLVPNLCVKPALIKSNSGGQKCCSDFRADYKLIPRIMINMFILLS